MAQPKAVVDGANVAYVEQSESGKPKMSNIIQVRKALEEQGYDTIVIIDAALRHDIDDPQQLEALLDDQRIYQAPAGTDADYFVLKMADDLDAVVVSNDRYRTYRDEYPWLDQRRMPLMIINGRVQLYQPGEDDKAASA